MKTGSFILNKGKMADETTHHFAGLNTPKGEKTALVLSGGGGKGAYECGVWRALSELGIHLDMVVGVSIGALNAAMVVQKDPLLAEYLWHELETDALIDIKQKPTKKDFAMEFFRQGGADTSGMEKLLKRYGDDQALRTSEIDLGILTVEFPSRKPLYIWKDDMPKGQIPDYIMASASAFPAIKPHRIGDKEYIDGGYENNLPVAMAVEHGASDVIAVNLNVEGNFRREELSLPKNLVYITPRWDLGGFLDFDTENSCRIMRLGYFDCMKIYDVFEGNRFTFVKDTFEEKMYPYADAAGMMFEMDPLVLYSRQSFFEALKNCLADLEEDTAAMKKDLKKIRPETIKEMFTKLNRKTFTIIMARDLKEKKQNSLFWSPRARKFLEAFLPAAKFLIANNLV